MTALANIIDYLRHEREPIEPWRLAAELARIDRLWRIQDAAYEVRTLAEYADAIVAAVKAGQLRERNGRVELVSVVRSEGQKNLF